MTEDLLILGELIAEQAAHMDAAEHRLLANIRQFDERDGWTGAISCAHWLAWRVGWTLVTAREHVRVAKALGKLPHIDDALRLGKVSYCKVRAMTRVATPENEQGLLLAATQTTGSQLEKLCRKYKLVRRLSDGADPSLDAEQRRVTRRELDNGMVMIQAVLHAEEAALVWGAIDRATKDVLRAASRAATPPAHVSAVTPTREVRSDVRDASAETLCREGASDLGDAPAETPCRDDGSDVGDSSAETPCRGDGSDVGDASAETASRERESDESARTVGARAGAASTDAASSRHRDLQVTADDRVTSEPSEAQQGASSDVRRQKAQPCVIDERDNVELYAVSTTDCTSTLLSEYYDLAEIEEQQRRATWGAFHRDLADCGEPDGKRDRDIGGSIVLDAVDRSADQAPAASARDMKARFDRADGLVALARRFAMGESSRSPVEVIMTVPASSLAEGTDDEESLAVLADGSCLPAESARRLACDAGIVRVIEDEHGRPLSVERRTRSIPSSVRRALFKRDTCCRFPGCTNTVYLEGHHIEHWARGGKTLLSNMCLLCSRHHHYVHEYGYRIETDAAGEHRFFDPRGRAVLDVPDRLQRDDLGWSHLQSANRDLAIRPYEGGWNGERVIYDDCCRLLYRLDEGTLRPGDIV